MNFLGKMKLKVMAAVLSVFVLGCLTGAALDSAYRLRARGQGRPSTQGKQEFFESLKSNLNLNDQQAAQIRAIIEETRDNYRQLRTEVSPQYDAIRQRARTRIRALLMPDQQQKFDAMIAERDARHNGNER
ncbi:MAG TPA: hypothetical protein VK619_13210 [Pyrinomonadaceae bacterium]|nr:hypothetical protein [Pyrinomonadaceae bacterium]